jgi:hypothetical protein
MILSNGAAFPGDNKLDGREVWKEYMGLRGEASRHEQKALDQREKDPRGALVEATVAVSVRIEALTYLISKAKVF